MKGNDRRSSTENKDVNGMHLASKSPVGGTLQLAQKYSGNSAQAELQAMVDNSNRVGQLKALQQTADSSPQVKQLKALGDVANRQSAVTQLYPIIGKKGSFASLKGRPGGHSNPGTKDAIIDEIFSLKDPRNDHEAELRKMSRADAKIELRGTWLSSNGCAICHKQPISAIEDNIVQYANNPDPSAAAMFRDWIGSFFPTDPLGLKGSAVAIAKKIISGKADDDDLDDLINLIDRSPDNLYIGDSPTNSGIGANFDFNFDLSDPTDLSLAPPSPRSKDIYDKDHSLGAQIGYVPSSPVREVDSSGDTYVKSSGASGLVYSAQ